MKPTENPKVMKENKRLCDSLIQARKDLDITQQILADKLAITRTTYSKKEKGILPFTLPEFVLLNQVLQLYTTIGKSIVIQKISRVERAKVKRAHALLEEVMLKTEKMEDFIDEYGE